MQLFLILSSMLSLNILGVVCLNNLHIWLYTFKPINRYQLVPMMSK